MRIPALLAILLIAGSAPAAVVLDMPAPAPKPHVETPTTYVEWNGSDTPAPPTVGDVALHRYGRARVVLASTGPRLTGADFYAAYGGYRVGLSPSAFGGRQDWRGADLVPFGNSRY